MGSVSLTGKDSFLLDARILSDFADGDVGALEFSNDIATVKTGKNGNSIYAFNAQGATCTLTLRIIRGSGDDKYLNGRFYEYKNDPPSFVLLACQITKRAGDGEGNITSDTYTLSGGIITKPPAVKENTDGDTEQAVAIWTITFTNSDRAL
jgi:hypothetical protein